MKTLLKISCVLVIALFVSMSVNAQTLGNEVTTGDITVNVPAFLKLTVTTPTVSFIYDEYGVGSSKTMNTWVDIQANIAWKFGVKADAPLYHTGTFSRSANIALSNITYSHTLATAAVVNEVLTTSDNLKDGSMNSQKAITWDLNTTTLGNLPAGLYSANLTYKLTE